MIILSQLVTATFNTASVTVTNDAAPGPADTASNASAVFTATSSVAATGSATASLTTTDPKDVVSVPFTASFIVTAIFSTAAVLELGFEVTVLEIGTGEALLELGIGVSVQKLGIGVSILELRIGVTVLEVRIEVSVLEVGIGVSVLKLGTGVSILELEVGLEESVEPTDGKQALTATASSPFFVKAA